MKEKQATFFGCHVLARVANFHLKQVTRSDTSEQHEVGDIHVTRQPCLKCPAVRKGDDRLDRLTLNCGNKRIQRRNKASQGHHAFIRRNLCHEVLTHVCRCDDDATHDAWPLPPQHPEEPKGNTPCQSSNINKQQTLHRRTVKCQVPRLLDCSPPFSIEPCQSRFSFPS